MCVHNKPSTKYWPLLLHHWWRQDQFSYILEVQLVQTITPVGTKSSVSLVHSLLWSLWILSTLLSSLPLCLASPTGRGFFFFFFWLPPHHPSDLGAHLDTGSERNSQEEWLPALRRKKLKSRWQKSLQTLPTTVGTSRTTRDLPRSCGPETALRETKLRDYTSVR